MLFTTAFITVLTENLGTIFSNFLSVVWWVAIWDMIEILVIGNQEIKWKRLNNQQLYDSTVRFVFDNKVEDKKGYFTRGESWIVITDMTKNDLLNAWILQAGIIAVKQPAGIFAVICVVILVVNNNNDTLVVCVGFCGIIKATGAGNWILSFCHQKCDLQIPGGHLIKTGLDDLRI